VHGLMTQYGFDGVDIDLENGLNPTYMAQALRDLRGRTSGDLIITMAPQTLDMQSTGASYFQLALKIKDILTVVHMQYYNSGAMLGCDQKVYGQGTVDFMTALACIQLENGLRADQVALGLPAGAGAAGGGVVPPSMVTSALDCLAKGTRCGQFKPTRTYPDIRGAMTWSINWDVTNGNAFARTVRPHLDTLP
jgi:chitinase